MSCLMVIKLNSMADSLDMIDELIDGEVDQKILFKAVVKSLKQNNEILTQIHKDFQKYNDTQAQKDKLQDDKIYAIKKKVDDMELKTKVIEIEREKAKKNINYKLTLIAIVAGFLSQIKNIYDYITAN